MAAGLILTVTTTRMVFRIGKDLRVATGRRPKEVCGLAAIDGITRRSWLHRSIIGVHEPPLMAPLGSLVGRPTEGAGCWLIRR
jgi:hypothetical protein